MRCSICQQREIVTKGMCMICYKRKWINSHSNLEEYRKEQVLLTKKWRDTHPENYHKLINEYNSKNKEKIRNLRKEHPEIYQKWRKENSGKIRTYWSKWKKKNPEKLRIQKKKYNEKYPEKRKARKFVEYNLKQNRPIVCSKCGTTDKKIHGHHPDYSKPDFVEWICQDCHNNIHNGRSI